MNKKLIGFLDFSLISKTIFRRAIINGHNLKTLKDIVHQIQICDSVLKLKLIHDDLFGNRYKNYGTEMKDLINPILPVQYNSRCKLIIKENNENN